MWLSFPMVNKEPMLTTFITSIAILGLAPVLLRIIYKSCTINCIFFGNPFPVLNIYHYSRKKYIFVK